MVLLSSLCIHLYFLFLLVHILQCRAIFFHFQTFLSKTFQHAILDVVQHLLSLYFELVYPSFNILYYQIYNANTILGDSYYPRVDFVNHIFFSIALIWPIFLTFLRYSSSNFSFSCLCLIWPSCSLPKYLYPAVSVSFLSSPSRSFNPSQCFILPCCIVKTLHLCMPNFIPMFGRICALCFLKSLVLFHSSHRALGYP